MWLDAHERLLVSGFLLGGFLVHYVTFRSLEVGMTLAVLGLWLVLAALCMLAIPLSDRRGVDWEHQIFLRLRLAIPFVLQIAFGSLLSMALLFYWFSGTVFTDWPLLILLVGLIFFNERFRHAYTRPWAQMMLFSCACFAYVSVVFPYVFHSLEPGIVLLGGVVSFGLNAGLIYLLSRLTPALRKQAWPMLASVAALFCVLSGLYLTNMLPPVPLALREAGIYHRVQRSGNEYVFTGEAETIWQRLAFGRILHIGPGERAYAYTSIYSPTELYTLMYHRWERYDERRKVWRTTDRLAFPITGGRADGYRGYSFKTALEPGRWRVSVETARGQTLGRIPFRVIR